MTIKVKVFLFSTLQTDRFVEQSIQLPENASVPDLLALLGINKNDVGILVINKKDATFNSRLKQGDTITMIPPIGGG